LRKNYPVNTAQYIINDLPPLTPTNTVKDAQQSFSQLTYSHIPICSENEYLGCISENDVHCFDAQKQLKEYAYAMDAFFVSPSTNWLDILEAFAQSNSNIMPVLDKNNTYLGYYELSDIIAMFNETPFLNETGGILVVEKGIQEYSFSEVSQIIESNGGKIFGLFISKMDPEIVQITIKIGHQQINTIAQTFRRYAYTILSQHEEDTFMEDLKKRSDYLNRYLNI